MKKAFRIYTLENKKVSVPTDDYYRRNEWMEDEIQILSPLTNEDYDSEQEALESMKEFKYEFTILPFYSFK